MKTMLRLALGLVILLGLAGSAEAATSKITLTLDEGLSATAAIDNKDNFVACRIAGRYAVAEVPNSRAPRSDLGKAQAGDDFPNNEASSFVVSALEPGAKAECTKDPRGSVERRSRPWETVDITPLVYGGKPGKNPSFAPPAFSPGNDWLVYTPRWRKALSNAIGEPKACKVFGPGGAEKRDITCTPGAVEGDGLVRFKLDQDFEPSQISVTFSGAKSPSVNVRVVPCTYDVSGDLTSIVQGATHQQMRFSSKQYECLGRLNRLTSLIVGNDRIHAAPKQDIDMAFFDEAPSRWVELSAVPGSLPLGEQTFQLKGATGSLGKAGIVVVSKITTGATPKIGITYQVPSTLGDFEPLFQGANGVSEGIAVVTPQILLAGGWVKNSTKLTYPPLPTTPQDASGLKKDDCPQDVEQNIENTFRGESQSTSLVWRLQSPDNQIDIKTLNGPRPDVVDFAVASPQPQPIKIALKLFAKTRTVTEWVLKGPPKKACIVERTNERLLLESEVTLADSARVESVPLPIRDRLYVDCRGAPAPIFDGHMRSIAHDDVSNGTCALVFVDTPYSDIKDCSQWKSFFKTLVPKAKDEGAPPPSPAPNALQKLQDAVEQGALTPKSEPNSTKLINPLFGPQRLLVTFRRDGAEISSQLWDVDPRTSNMLVLPKGSDGKAGDMYEVEVRIAAKSNNGIHYRGAVADEGSASLSPPAERHFKASLRSRGIFGIPPISCKPTVSVRIYATVPVQLTGFRFPAAPGELRSSSDATGFQYLTPRVGLLGVVEPWNYDTGQPAWPLNVNLAVGLLALELTKPRLELSSLLGVQVKLPLGEPGGQLASTAALGFFWEHDLTQPPAIGNRFLISFGANVFSLFSGK